MLILIGFVIIFGLFYPKPAHEGYIPDKVEAQYSDNYIVAQNISTTIYTSKVNPNIKKRYQDLELYQYFIDKSIELGIDVIYNIPFADCLIIEESQWNPKADNPTSTAYGLGQFLDRTWSNVNKALGGNLDRDDPYDQIDAFTYLLATEGYKHWTVAPSCIYILPIGKRIASLK